MVSSYIYEKEVGCDSCPNVRVKRTIIAKLDTKSNIRYIRGTRANREELIQFKAFSKRNGNIRQYDVKRVGSIGSSSRLGQAAQAIGSIITPGNISPYRSPIRSGISRALTPGKPGGGRGMNRRNRTSRCPEGYQYGGRFTDNQFSTCGQQLFDIPSPLGATIRALREQQRAAGRPRGNESVGTPITGSGTAGSDLVKRQPNIPRVAQTTNKRLRDQRVAEAVKALGKKDINAVQMVRRDGFVLEPVVTARVLRTIPDNRDMVDATYVMTAKSAAEIGDQELGLLSNTGITNVTYVFSDGSFVQLKKMRALTRGERRKLGRTVNAAMKVDNKNDPLARLKYVSDETGDGIGVVERLKGGRTVEKILSGASAKIRRAETPEADTSKATTLEVAAEIIRDGGDLSSISPTTLQQAISKTNLFKKTAPNTYKAADGRVYTLRTSQSSGEHITQSMSSAIQDHLGLNGIDIAFVGDGSAKRKYLSMTPESEIIDGALTREKSMKDLDTDDVARLMVSDIIADIEQRPSNSIAIFQKNEEIAPIATWAKSELVDLSDIKIRERTQKKIREFASIQANGLYGKYYSGLQDSQKRRLQEQIDQLLQRARKFNFTKYRDKLYSDGQLSDAEKTHLNIVAKIMKTRIDALLDSREVLMRVLGGQK